VSEHSAVELRGPYERMGSEPLLSAFTCCALRSPQEHFPGPRNRLGFVQLPCGLYLLPFVLSRPSMLQPQKLGYRLLRLSVRAGGAVLQEFCSHNFIAAIQYFSPRLRTCVSSQFAIIGLSCCCTSYCVAAARMQSTVPIPTAANVGTLAFAALESLAGEY
jgi:hypothetical protein